MVEKCLRMVWQDGVCGLTSQKEGILSVSRQNSQPISALQLHMPVGLR